MSPKRIALTVLVVLTLLLAALLTSSCGGGGGTATGTTPASTSLSGKAEIDNYLNQLDSQMNSLNADDFSESQLNDQNLGI